MGASFVGKTSTARCLAASLGVAARHCGDVLKREAARSNARPPFPIALHREVDAQSRLWTAVSDSVRIIEGRFLQHVLVGIPGLLLVRLVCDLGERARRLEAARGLAGGRARLRQSDREDIVDVALLYGTASAPIVPAAEVDTSAMRPGRVAAIIRGVLDDVA